MSAASNQHGARPRRLKPLDEKITDQLFSLICEGGGDETTLARYARRIARLARNHIAEESRRQLLQEEIET